MSEDTPPSVTFDVDALHDALEATVQGTLRSLVVFTRESFDVVSIDELSRSFYDSEEHMMAHFGQIHSYVDMDFLEIELFTDELFPVANRVRYLVTGFDMFTLVRVYGPDEGVFLAIDPDEPVEPLVRAAEAVMLSDDDGASLEEP